MEISSSSSTLNPVQEDQQPGSPLVFQHTISSPLKLHGNNNDTVEADEDVRRAVEQAVSSNLTAGKKPKNISFSLNFHGSRVISTIDDDGKVSNKIWGF